MLMIIIISTNLNKDCNEYNNNYHYYYSDKNNDKNNYYYNSDNNNNNNNDNNHNIFNHIHSTLFYFILFYFILFSITVGIQIYIDGVWSIISRISLIIREFESFSCETKNGAEPLLEHTRNN